MNQLSNFPTYSRHTESTEFLRQSIVKDIEEKGYSVNPFSLPLELADSLLTRALNLPKEIYQPAGVGRQSGLEVNHFVRNDNIAWIAGEHEIEGAWLAFTDALMQDLNRSLYLGLRSFESHFAIYPEKHFYKRHLDAFKGASNRKVSIVAYLNHQWDTSDGGELVLYNNCDDVCGLKIQPTFATLVVFLSEEFPHEVLPATRERISIAGWYSVVDKKISTLFVDHH